MRGSAAAMPTMARRSAARAVAESIVVGVISAVWFEPDGGDCGGGKREGIIENKKRDSSSMMRDGMDTTSIGAVMYTGAANVKIKCDSENQSLDVGGCL